MSKNPSVKILVSYHKKATLLKDKVLMPIHVGRALKNEEHKDGKCSNKELNWLYENMIGDDTGENISSWNRNINEMTAVYWAWKNYEKLGNPDYIGLAHYRSVLLLAPMPRYYEQTLEESLGYSYDLYNQLRDDMDFLAGEFYTRGYSVKQDWINMTTCTTDREVKHIEWMDEYIKNNIADMYPFWDEYLNQDKLGGQKSIFVMKKQWFFEYCEFMFKMIGAMRTHFVSDGVNEGNCRVVGKAAEFLSSFYFWYLAKKGLKYRTFPIVNVPTFENKDAVVKDLLNYNKLYFKLAKYKFAYNLTFGNKRKYYACKKQVIKERIEAVKEYKQQLGI